MSEAENIISEEIIATIDGMRTIIDFMINNNYVGGKIHTEEDNLLKKLKRTKANSKDILKVMKRSGWFFREKKQGEWAYSLAIKTPYITEYSDFMKCNYEKAIEIFNQYS
jgi:hypothetical protein